jgi:hypothetical protein
MKPLGFGSGVTLPSGVLERLPSLKDQRCLFFDFGLMLVGTPVPVGAEQQQQQQQQPAHQLKEAVVAVITDMCLVVASFPRPTRPTRIITHQHVAGVSRDGDRVTVHAASDSDVVLFLAKADMFVVYMADLQDRAVGRQLLFASKESAPFPQQQQQQVGAGVIGSRYNNNGADVSQGYHAPLTAHALAALKAAADARHPLDETAIGVVRLGTSSRREHRPCREVEEGSDASSVQTLEHLVEDEIDDLAPPDMPQVAIDATMMHRRLYYFFLQYDRSKMPFIDRMIGQHRGQESQLMRDLEAQYGPEPNKGRWDARDQLAHQRALKFQLTAQLRRAKDELLVLEREETSVRAAMDDVLRQKNAFLAEQRQQQAAAQSAAAGASAAAMAAKNKQPLLHLIKVLRPADAGQSGSLLLSSSDFAQPAEQSFYFLLPFMFFDFVREQSVKVPGATMPPLVTMVNETTDKQFAVNWSFLGGWASDFGPHCVSYQDRETRLWRVVPGKKFWQLY